MEVAEHPPPFLFPLLLLRAAVSCSASFDPLAPMGLLITAERRDSELGAGLIEEEVGVAGIDLAACETSCSAAARVGVEAAITGL